MSSQFRHGVAAVVSLLLLLGGVVCVAQGPPSKPKVLIEFGWDEPDTAYLRRHVATMERTPFDGCVFHANTNTRDAAGQSESLTWKFWGRRTFTESELAQAFEDLRATTFRRFRHNLLRINTTPADLDWFDDHAAIVANARLAARLAREGKCRGVLFDVEQYQGPLFNFRKQKHASSKSWEAYAMQARQRGVEVMKAMQEGFPGLTVVFTFGPSLVETQRQGGKVKVEDTEYGLLEPFLAGMASARTGDTTLIDGHEPSYGYKTPERFDDALATMRKAGPSFQAGFGLWLDYDWRTHGWQVDAPERNYFTPKAFGAAVRAALERTDGVVWVYTETPRWWSPEDALPSKLPPAYLDALRSARLGLTAD